MVTKELQELLAEKEKLEKSLANDNDPTIDHAYNFFYFYPKHLKEERLKEINKLIGNYYE